MEEFITKPWIIIREPGTIKVLSVPSSEIDLFEKLWINGGKTVLRIDGARIMLIGSLKWTQQFFNIGEFNDRI